MPDLASAHSIYGPDGRVLKQVASLSVINSSHYGSYGWVQSLVHGLNNPDTVSVDTYEKMLADETVRSGLQFLSFAVLSRLQSYTNKNGVIEKFVRDVIEDMDCGLHFYVSEILTAIPFGHSASENVYFLRADGKIGLADIQTMHPGGVKYDLEERKDHMRRNRIARVWQKQRRSGEYVEIPRAKCILYTFTPGVGNWSNPYGTPALRAAWGSWYLKKVMMRGWALTLERYGTPLGLGKVKNGHVPFDVDGKGTKMTGIDFVNRMLQQLQSTSTAAVDDSVSIEFIRAGQALGADFDQIMAYLNKMIYRALAVPSLMADHDDKGSYALGKAHFDLFVIMLENIVNDIVNILIDQVVTPLILLNFGPQDNYGTFRTRPFRVGDQQALANTFLVLTNSGFMSPDDQDDFDHVRNEFGLVLKPIEEFTPRQTATPEPGGTPGQPQPVPTPRETAGTIPQPVPQSRQEKAAARRKAEARIAAGEQPDMHASVGPLTTVAKPRLRDVFLADSEDLEPALA